MLIFLPTTIVGGIIFILRKFFEQILSRDIENYKAKLQVEFEHSKIRLENALQIKFFEFQTKFSLYHQKRAEVTSEIYGMLSEAIMSASILVHPIQFGSDKSQHEKIDETALLWKSLSDFYRKHRIYLDEDVCDKMDSLLKTVNKALINFGMSQEKSQNPTADRKMWEGAWKIMENEVPPIQKGLERQFRQCLSAHSDSVV
jgi:hypothetical protein